MKTLIFNHLEPSMKNEFEKICKQKKYNPSEFESEKIYENGNCFIVITRNGLNQRKYYEGPYDSIPPLAPKIDWPDCFLNDLESGIYDNENPI